MIQWRIELLGGLCARRDEVSVTRFRTHKTGALLALLALSGQRHIRREEAIELLWPNETTDSGRSRLRMALSDLRKHLQTGTPDATTPLLLADRQHLHLAPAGYVTDKDEFETLLARTEQIHNVTERINLLTTASALYQGELLAGYDEPWLAGERQRLADLYLLALRRLVKALATDGQLERALAYARRSVEADPLREEAHRAVMQLYVGMGRPALALQQYRHLEVLLHDALSVAPSTATRQVLEQCLQALTREEAASSSATPRQEATPRASSGGTAATAEPSPACAPLLPPANLPQSVTSFIGRDQELEEVSARLAQTRLLTLTGSGGCGKTRLALEAARRLLSVSPDGVWLIELAPLTEASFVLQAIAEALGVREEAGKTLAHTLVAHLKSRTLLLVLDNCEHLLSACAQSAALLLRECPHVTLLASSREPLSIAGESVYRVPSLQVPDDPTLLTLSNLENYSALQLFVERARAVSSTFRVDATNLSALGQICARLDGIPLALELAAARVRSLSLGEINRKLDDRFHLLTGGSRASLPRHQTLRALIDYSYDLLNAQEKALLRRLSIFAGGWTLTAAEQVASGEASAGESIEEWAVLDLLSSLVDKSLVSAELPGESTRYRLLQTVRQYALDRLGREENTTLNARHRDYFLRLAEEVKLKLRGSEQAQCLDILETEHSNLRQALTFYLKDPEGGAKGLRLGAVLQRFWRIRGHLSEGRESLIAVLAHSGAQTHTEIRTDVLNGAAILSSMQGDFASARVLLEESLITTRELGDKAGISDSLNNLGLVARNLDDYVFARSLLEESLAIARELGDRNSIVLSLEALGFLAMKEKKDEHSARLWGAVAALRETLGSPLPPHERENYECMVATIQAVLGEAEFATAWAAGHAMTLEQAVAYALNEV